MFTVNNEIYMLTAAIAGSDMLDFEDVKAAIEGDDGFGNVSGGRESGLLVTGIDATATAVDSASSAKVASSTAFLLTP